MSKWYPWWGPVTSFKVEYDANAEYENPLNYFEKMVFVGQKLMFPIMEKVIPYHAISF